jgi:hypothetical protein
VVTLFIPLLIVERKPPEGDPPGAGFSQRKLEPSIQRVLEKERREPV